MRHLSCPLVEDLVAAVAVVVGREQAVPEQAVPVHREGRQYQYNERGGGCCC